MSNIIELKFNFTGCLIDKRMNKMRKIFHCFIKRGFSTLSLHFDLCYSMGC